MQRARLAWRAIVIAVGCSMGCSSSPKPAPVDPTPVEPAQPPPYDVAPVAEDPPEPTPPAAECAFDRSVFCVTGQPTVTALQPSPFEQCARTEPARKRSVVPYDAQFSAGETRVRRDAEPAACCYVEFTANACD